MIWKVSWPQWRLWMRSPDLICTKMHVQVHNWFSFSLEGLKFQVLTIASSFPSSITHNPDTPFLASRLQVVSHPAAQSTTPEFFSGTLHQTVLTCEIRLVFRRSLAIFCTNQEHASVLSMRFSCCTRACRAGAAVERPLPITTAGHEDAPLFEGPVKGPATDLRVRCR